MISPDRALAQVSPGEPLPAAAWNYASSPPQLAVSTSHLSIVDAFGDAVSMTTSVQSTFGSQLIVGGFILNNQLTDFSYQPTSGGLPVANRADGGKKPLSSMSPTIVLDPEKRLRLVIGSPGGERIIGFVAQAVIGVIDWDLDVQQAVAAPHFLAADGPLELEDGTGLTAHRAALEAMGHTVAVRAINSGLHGIEVERAAGGDVVLLGGVDPRREGVALGD